MGTQARSRLLRRLEKIVNKTACANELGDFAFVLLNSIQALSPRATVNGVLMMVLEETGDMLDVAQTYMAFGNFSKENGWIRDTGTAPSTEGGRPMKTFAITKEGREALKRKAEHLQRLLAYQQRAEALSMKVVQDKT